MNKPIPSPTSWETPRVEDYGDLAELTLTTGLHDNLDGGPFNGNHHSQP